MKKILTFLGLLILSACSAEKEGIVKDVPQNNENSEQIETTNTEQEIPAGLDAAVEGKDIEDAEQAEQTSGASETYDESGSTN